MSVAWLAKFAEISERKAVADIIRFTPGGCPHRRESEVFQAVARAFGAPNRPYKARKRRKIMPLQSNLTERFDEIANAGDGATVQSLRQRSRYPLGGLEGGELAAAFIRNVYHP